MDLIGISWIQVHIFAYNRQIRIDFDAEKSDRKVISNVIINWVPGRKFAVRQRTYLQNIHIHTIKNNG